MKAVENIMMHVLVFVAALFLTSCVANQVHYKRSIALTESFETNTVLPGYTFYYSGPYVLPEAILGIKKGYELEADFWKKVDVSEKTLKHWGTSIDTFNHPTSRYPYYASYILDDNGNEIGIWYSFIHFPNAIKLKENVYKIFAPPARNLLLNEYDSSGI